MVDFYIEPLSSAQLDIEGMLAAQWRHTGEPEIECKPNWKFYRQMNEIGACMVVMARRDDVPVGYLAAFIYPHFNSVDHLIASIPTYFVKEGPGRALILVSLVDFAIQQLADRGVIRVDIDTNAENSAGRLWELKGFKLAKLGYSLKLKRASETRNA